VVSELKRNQLKKICNFNHIYLSIFSFNPACPAYLGFNLQISSLLVLTLITNSILVLTLYIPPYISFTLFTCSILVVIHITSILNYFSTSRTLSPYALTANAPKGAVNIMAITAMAKIICPEATPMESGIAPIAACTVALGI